MANIFIYISLIWFSVSPVRMEMKQIQHLFFPSHNENHIMKQKRINNMALHIELYKTQKTLHTVKLIEEHCGDQAVVERQKTGVHFQWVHGFWQSNTDSKEFGFME